MLVPNRELLSARVAPVSAGRPVEASSLMVSELLIACLVLVLAAYWFRYNCRSILKTESSRQRARQVASANQLGFAEIDEHIEGGLTANQLDDLSRSLLRDYKVLTCLLRYTAPPGRTHNIEQRLLMADFRLMQGWYVLTRLYLRGPARRSLDERARILIHFANTLADRSPAAVRV
jgi:hypothetical protein